MTDINQPTPSFCSSFSLFTPSVVNVTVRVWRSSSWSRHSPQTISLWPDVKADSDKCFKICSQSSSNPSDLSNSERSRTFPSDKSTADSGDSGDLVVWCFLTRQTSLSLGFVGVVFFWRAEIKLRHRKPDFLFLSSVCCCFLKTKKICVDFRCCYSVSRTLSRSSR